MVNAEKYGRSVSLLCPTCGGDQFEYEGEGEGESVEVAKCGACGRELTRDELIEANGETIAANFEEMTSEITKDVAGEMQKIFKKAFRGSKVVKFR